MTGAGASQTQDITLLDLLSEISARGWLVNNLFQHEDATWQANLRSATHVTMFGCGHTPSAALDAALASMPIPRTPQPVPSWSLPADQPAPDLLALLGITHPRTITPAAPGRVRRL